MAIYIRDKQGDLTALNIPAIKGKSAYEVALSNGFKGTEQKWLESLKGENGSEEVYIGTTEEAPSTASMVIDPEEDNEYDGFFTDSKYDYLGKEHSTLKAVNDSNIEHVLRRVSTQKYEGSSIVANNTYMKQVNNVILKGVTKFKDLDTGEFIDRFEEGRNLELVGGKSEKVKAENHIEAISAGLIEIKSYNGTADIIKTDNSNFIIKTGGRRAGVQTSNFYTANIGGSNLGKYIIEFDGKLLKGDISSSLGVHLTAWSNFIEGYNSILPTDGKYRAVIQSATNTVNNRATQFMILPGVTGAVEYEIKNLKVYCVINPNSEHKSSELISSINTPLYSIGEVYDYIDLNTGVYVKNIEMRAYQSGDESDSEVLTDKKNTLYKLEQPIVSKIDLQGQKVYSYDGTTHYTCQSESGYPSPILSMEVPTDLASLVQEERAINQKLYNDQNTIIDSQLSLYESMSNMLLKDSNDIVPEYIQDLYELAYERGIRIRKQEVDINENTR